MSSRFYKLNTNDISIPRRLWVPQNCEPGGGRLLHAEQLSAWLISDVQYKSLIKATKQVAFNSQQ